MANLIDEEHREVVFAHQRHRLLEILLSLAWSIGASSEYFHAIHCIYLESRK